VPPLSDGPRQTVYCSIACRDRAYARNRKYPISRHELRTRWNDARIQKTQAYFDLPGMRDAHCIRLLGRYLTPAERKLLTNQRRNAIVRAARREEFQFVTTYQIHVHPVGAPRAKSKI
jgi:hypothetical protein